MNAILFLLAVGTLFGRALGRHFSWVAILASGIALAVLAAAVLQREGFGALAGIATIVACLTVNQIAYLAGVNHLRTFGALRAFFRANAEDLRPRHSSADF